MQADATIFTKSAPGIISVKGAAPAWTPLSERMATIEAVCRRAVEEGLAKSASIHLMVRVSKPPREPDAVECVRHATIRLDSDADTEGVLETLAEIFRNRPDVEFDIETREEGRSL